MVEGNITRKFSEDEILEMAAQDARDIAGHKDYGTGGRVERARLHNETWDEFVSLGLQFSAFGQNQFEFVYKNKKFLYFPKALKWCPAHNRKMYFCKGLKHTLEILDRPYPQPKLKKSLCPSLKCRVCGEDCKNLCGFLNIGPEANK